MVYGGLILGWWGELNHHSLGTESLINTHGQELPRGAMSFPTSCSVLKWLVGGALWETVRASHSLYFQAEFPAADGRSWDGGGSGSLELLLLLLFLDFPKMLYTGEKKKKRRTHTFCPPCVRPLQWWLTCPDSTFPQPLTHASSATQRLSEGWTEG